MEREWKPNNTELSPACPRCGASNTKFCYYNNYSLTQPRYFCKGCRRYWTKGGSLRNVPVGGGCRKSRRGRSIRAAAASRNSLQTSTPILDHPTCSASIDLAAVYANFLNQPPPPPENRAATALPELPVGMNNQCLSSNFFQESNFLESGCFLGGVASAAAGNDFEGLSVLPPLPGEEAAVSEGVVWRSSEMLLHNQMLELREEMRGEEENLMMSGNLEAIFKC